jgi:hypothetical protein
MNESHAIVILVSDYIILTTTYSANHFKGQGLVSYPDAIRVIDVAASDSIWIEAPDGSVCPIISLTL